jgi:hypothetical protein
LQSSKPRRRTSILRPGLAAALPVLRAAATPLKRAFDLVDAQLCASIKQARLAARNLARLHQAFSLKLG